MVVGADLERAVSPHQQADGASLFVAQQLYVPRTALLPLWWVVLTRKAVQLRPPTHTHTPSQDAHHFTDIYTQDYSHSLEPKHTSPPSPAEPLVQIFLETGL